MKPVESIFMHGEKVVGNEVYLIENVCELDPATGRAKNEGTAQVALVDRGEISFHADALEAQRAYMRKHRITDKAMDHD